MTKLLPRMTQAKPPATSTRYQPTRPSYQRPFNQPPRPSYQRPFNEPARPSYDFFGAAPALAALICPLPCPPKSIVPLNESPATFAFTVTTIGCPPPGIV
jgi:hypothetical protein